MIYKRYWNANQQSFGLGDPEAYNQRVARAQSCESEVRTANWN
jgi:hypothetical protein